MSHISLVTLGVRDLARATAFYESLGWRPSSTSVEGTVTFFHGTPVLALFGRDALADDAHLAAVEDTPPGSVALAVNVGSPAEVDRVITAAREAGATVPKEPRPTEWGGYSGYFMDGDGHLWEVAHNPGFALGAGGAISLPDA
jgi:uncharacterized protein